MPKSDQLFLGIDVGTSGTKTLLVNSSGQVLAESDANYPMQQPRPGWTEQDPEDWWKAVKKTVKAVLKKAAADPAAVVAIGLSGQMHGSVFLDEKDQVIRPALLWNDQRTTAQCEAIESAAGSRRKLIGMVANPALTGFQAPKILWLRDHEPKHFDRLRKVLLPKDDIRRRMTGNYVTEVSDASGTLLLDVRKRRWSRKLMTALDLDMTLLPEVVESHQVTGNLTATAAKALGLTTDCVVVGGAGDCAAGAVGNGIVKSGVLSTSIGTSGVMFVHSDAPEVDAAGRLHTFCHAVDGKWHMMGVNLTSGGSLQWWVENVLRGLGGKDPKNAFQAATKEAEAASPGSGGLLFLPYLNGERTPHADPLARGVFAGLNLSHDRGDMTRAVMEGITMALRDSLEIIRDCGVPVRQIRASGGGSKNPFWRQLQADVFGQKITTLQVEQGPAYGVALLAMVGAGSYRDIGQACRATIRVADETKPKREATKVYDRLFPIYRDLYAQSRDVVHQLGEFQNSISRQG